MKKEIIIILFLGLMCGLRTRSINSENRSYELRSSFAKLVLDKNGNVIITQAADEKAITVSFSVNELWDLGIRNNVTNKEYSLKSSPKVKILEKNEVLSLVYDQFSIEGVKLPVRLELTISITDDAFSFSGNLHNSSDDWIFTDLSYPNIPGIKIDDDDIKVYWPKGLGECFENINSFGSKSFRYPCVYGSMPFISINSQKYGFYFGSHDSSLGMKDFYLSYDQKSRLFNASSKLPVYNNKYIIPPSMIMLYSGKWHEASKFYRSWFDNNFKIKSPPDWVIDNPGWMLAILKQQNGNVMWAYNDIDRLCDIAQQFNLTAIGLYGWAHGGHDRHYPEFIPDNLMGGRVELKNAINRAHERGIKIILYANAKNIDASSSFFQYLGNETMITDRKMNPVLSVWRKHKDSTPVLFAEMCPGSEIWRGKMHELALQAESLGADGILFDQLAGSPNLCFSTSHEHLVPQGSSDYKIKMVEEIKNHLRSMNPEFIIMAEGQTDATLDCIDYFHGCSSGYSITPNCFPALFKYTFPELVATQRNPNPMLTRTDANFAAIYGLRHEIELRYPGDVEYLKNGTLPTSDSYSNIYSPPDIQKMNLTTKEEAAKYLYSLIEFENDNADFFRKGKFIEEEGIEVIGDDITANGFVNGNRIGVVVWNRHLSEERNYSVSVQGCRLIRVSEPGENSVDVLTPLRANSIRLVVFERI